MKFKTILGLIVGSIASVIMYLGTVLGMGAWKEVSDARKAKKEAKAEESKTEEKPAEEEKTEE